MSESIHLEQIMFVGRKWQHYCDMFNLTDADLASRKVLDCPSGASTFTKVAADKGYDITACDIEYKNSPDEIEAKGRAHYDYLYNLTREQLEAIKTHMPEHLKAAEQTIQERLDLILDTLTATVADIRETGYGTRYVYGELPTLPFADEQFDLTLSGHLLFVYWELLDLDFHLASIRELMRVTKEEIRIYPLIDLKGERSPHLAGVVRMVEEEGWSWSEEEVPYDLQMPGTQMLRLRRKGL